MELMEMELTQMGDPPPPPPFAGQSEIGPKNPPADWFKNNIQMSLSLCKICASALAVMFDD